MKIKNKNFRSFENSFQNYSFSSFLKEAFDVVFSLKLEGRLLLVVMAGAEQESVKNLLFFLISNVIFLPAMLLYSHGRERFSLHAGRSLPSKQKIF